MQGTYIGLRPELKSQTALLKDKGETVEAQFDALNILPDDLTHGWTAFPKTDFAIRPEEPEYECNCLICLPEPHSRFANYNQQCDEARRRNKFSKRNL